MKHAHNCPMLARMNDRRDRSRAKAALFVLFVFFGMGFAAIALLHGYAVALDAIANPHMEGYVP